MTIFTFLMSVLISWEVSFNVSFYFVHDDVNHLWCSVVSIWLKIAHIQKYFRTCIQRKIASRLYFKVLNKMWVHKKCSQKKLFMGLVRL